MNGEAYAIASALYPVLLMATIAVGVLGYIVNRDGTRRVGMVMVTCQLVLLSLATFVGWPEFHLASMVIVNGLCAVPLLIRPPSPPPRLQRIAAGMFLGSALMNALFSLVEQTPSIVALHWFSSAAIDALMIVTLGGFCGGLVGKHIAGWLRDHAHRATSAGNSR